MFSLRKVIFAVLATLIATSVAAIDADSVITVKPAAADSADADSVSSAAAPPAVVVVSGGAADSAAGPDAVPILLLPGVTESRRMKPGESLSYLVDAGADHILHLVVEQEGIDVVAQLFDPDGRLLVEAATPGIAHGPEHLIRITEIPGEYRLEVHSLADKGEPGHVGARIERLTAAPEEIEERVDLLFAPWDRPDSPGAALAVTRGGELVYARGYGSAHLEYEIPIAPGTVFHVASVSKQFTSFAVAMLARQGLVSLDEDITGLLPEVPDLGAVITPRHLAHHTSGLRDQWELLAAAGWRLDDVITTEQIMRLVARQRELNFPPGAEHLYCNTGYTLLAVLVERLTGSTLREWTLERIFAPLGMSATHFHDDHREIVRNRAYSYAPLPGGGFRAAPLNYATVGATSLFTTAEDMARWLGNLDWGDLGGGPVLEQMHRAGVLSSGEEIEYAFGLMLGRQRGLVTVGHGGADAGYRSHVVRYPEHALSVVVLSNLASFVPRRLAEQVAEVYLAGLFPDPPGLSGGEVMNDPEVDPEVLQLVSGIYETGPGELLTASGFNGRLVVEVTGRPRTLARPRGGLAFVLPTYDTDLEFLPAEDGCVDSVLMGKRSGARMQPFAPGPEELGDYRGVFWSDELGTSYTIVLEGDGLVARHGRHEDLPLAPTVADRFSSGTWRLRTLQFTRGEDKDVDGFLLTGRRIRNVRFQRRDAAAP